MNPSVLSHHGPGEGKDYKLRAGASWKVLRPWTFVCNGLVIVMTVGVQGCALGKTVEQTRSGYRVCDSRSGKKRQETVLAVFCLLSSK